MELGRRRTYLVLLSFFVVSISITSYCVFSNIEPELEWSKTFGDSTWRYGNSVQQTTDGGYITAGSSSVILNGEHDIILIKTDSNGIVTWNKTFGGSRDEKANSVQQTSDGGYIIAGTTRSFSVVEGVTDLYLIKTDPSGVELWTSTFGGSDWEYGGFVQQTSDGGYILAGATRSFGAGGEDLYLIKTDSNGVEIWSKTFGGSQHEWESTVKQTTDGGYILAGTTETYGAGSYDAYLVKTDSNGDEIWSNTFGGSNVDRARSVLQASDGGYILLGWTSSFGAGKSDVYMVKTDSNGNELWSRTFGGSAGDVGYSVSQITGGGYIIAGGTSSFHIPSRNGAYFIKTDREGNVVWETAVGSSEYVDVAYSVQQTSDGGYIATGYRNYQESIGYVLYLLKISEDVNFSVPQNKLEVISEYGTLTGEGYYSEGSSASFSVSPTSVSGETGLRYVFSCWTSDSPGGYTSSDNPANVVMNNDITETAQWKTQYYLTMEAGDGGSVFPFSGWYEAGSEVTISATPESGYTFDSWGGSGLGAYSGSDASNTITMNDPQTAAATFQATVSESDDELLINGGFEDGSMIGWTKENGTDLWWDNQPGGPGPTEYGFVPFEGDWRVYLNPYDHENPAASQMIAISTAKFTLGWAVLPHSDLYPRLVTVTAYDSNNDVLIDDNGKFVELVYSMVEEYQGGQGYEIYFNIETRDPNTGINAHDYFERDFYYDYFRAGGNPNDFEQAAYIKLKFQALDGKGGTNFDAFSLKLVETDSYSEYILQLVSPYGSVSGEDYYIEDSSASFNVSPTTISGDSGTRYVFTGWTSDSQNGYTGSDNPASVVISNDVTEIAQWKTQYYLTMAAGMGGSVSPSSGWYDEGTHVTITATPDSGYSFHSWSDSGSGGYSGSDSPRTITMNDSITETASFMRTQDRTIIFSDDFEDNQIDMLKWAISGSVTLSDGQLIIGPNSKIRSVQSFGLLTLEYQMKTPQSDPSTRTNRLEAAGFRASSDLESHIFFTRDDTLTEISLGTKKIGPGWSSERYLSIDDRSEWHQYKIERYEDEVKFYQDNNLIFTKQTDITTALLEIEFGSIGDFTFYLDNVTVTGASSAPEHLLSATSNYSFVFGEGAYSEGSTASFSVSPTTISGDSGTRYVFTGWTSDSPGGYTGSDNPAIVVMSDDITHNAEWKTQYYLSVETEDGGSVSPPSGWYDEESLVTITVTPESGYRFNGWSGDGTGSYTGAQSNHTITMNSPITQTTTFERAQITTFFDDFSSDSGLWEYEGVSLRDIDNEYVILTNNKKSTWGHIWLNEPISGPFNLSFRFKAGGGSGADGFVILFYQTKEGFGVQPTNVAGYVLTGRYDTNGYGVEFDNYQNDHDPSRNHIALRDKTMNHLESVYDLRTEDNVWHDVSLEVRKSEIRVFVDSELMIKWEGQIDISNTAFGLGASCGADTNIHLIDDVMITLGKPSTISITPVVPTRTHTLTVTSVYGSTTGEGTYPEGTTATFTVSPSLVQQDGERHTLTGWSSTNRYGYTGTGTEASVIMQGDVREKAEWDTECYLTVYSEVPVMGAGWYADGSTVQLDADSPRGFLIRRVFQKWTGDIYSRDTSVSIVMNGAKSVSAEWSTDYSQALLVGVVGAVLVGGGGYVTVQRRRREDEIRAEALRMEQEAQATAELRTRVIAVVTGSDEIVVLEDVARSANVSEDYVRAIIDEMIGDGLLVGRFSNDGHAFITDKVLRKQIKDRIK